MNLNAEEIEIKLQSLIKNLEELPLQIQRRKSIFDIAGFPRRETVNSRMLYFYLNKNEEHKFDNLFFKSLLNLLDEDETLAEVDYKVFREYKNIDLLITYCNNEDEPSNDNEEFDWAIIIENKIHHQLNNDLKRYWNSINVKEGGLKLGIVLSPWQQNKNDLIVYNNGKNKSKNNILTCYKNILHRELTTKVLDNLPNYYIKSDDRHLLLLKEYISNIESMNTNKEHLKIQDQRLSIFQNNYNEIVTIIALQEEMRDHVVNASLKAMKQLGFKGTNPSTKVKGKLFFKNEKQFPDYFRFYFWYPELTGKGLLNVYFELHGDYVKYGNYIHQQPELKEIFKSFPMVKIANGNGKWHYHIGHLLNYNFRSTNTEKSFQEELTEALKTIFFDKENGLYWKCATLLEKVINEIK